MAAIPTNHPRNEFNPPQTLVRTSHSITISAQNGVTVGLIASWAPAQSKAITPVYEINVDTSGLPLENVPGNVTGLTIAVTRTDIWPARMEEAFGTVDLQMLSMQDRPFLVHESWTRPDRSLEVWQYEGCWFNQIGRSFRSDDNRIVQVNASLTYLYRRLIQK